MDVMTSVQVENLTYAYEKGSYALKDINLKICKGEMIAFTGKNGSGKTTLAKHLNGLLKPTSGRVFINGLDTTGKTVSFLAQQVGYVFQNPDHQIFNDTVYEEVAFGPKNQGLTGKDLEQRVLNALQVVGLETYGSTYPYKLSKGQRQRVALASVLAMDSDILVLDEPTTGLDYKESQQVMELVAGLHQKGRTIIFITHDMNLVARYAERMIVMANGEVIADGRPRDIFAQPKTIKSGSLKVPVVTLLAERGGFTSRTVLDEEEFIHDIYQYKRRMSLNVLCS
ncbi:MAG: ATP-binding cassette domain-containing protein [Bacillota bacterium]